MSADRLEVLLIQCDAIAGRLLRSMGLLRKLTRHTAVDVAGLCDGVFGLNRKETYFGGRLAAHSNGGAIVKTRGFLANRWTL